MTLTVGSLFSGIGGLDLGLERAGMKVIWQSEIDPFACKVLKKHWPEVPNYGDIKQIDWGTVEPPDVICGGYPCQPFSNAGKRNGTNDPRHLWPWVRNAISELRPDYAILENVRGHLSMGGLSVIGELADIGYNAEWRVVSAASVGANHRRDRLIIVAYPNGCESTNGRECEVVQGTSPIGRNDRGRGTSNFGQIGLGGTRQNPSDVADTDNTGNRTPKFDIDENRPPTQQRREIFSFAEPGRFSSIPRWWETEPDVGRVAHGVSNRMDRIRGLGNAVVPQVAEVIGRLVVAHAKTI